MYNWNYCDIELTSYFFEAYGKSPWAATTHGNSEQEAS